MATEIDDLKSDLRLAAEFTEKQADDDLMRSAAARIEALEAALAWIAKRCPEIVVHQLDEPTRLHVEMAYDAGACARAALPHP